VKFHKIDTVYKKWIFLFFSLVICSCGLSLFLLQQMKMRNYEKIKKADYHLKNDYVEYTILEKKTKNQDKRLMIKLKNGETVYLVEKEREFPKYPQIPNEIKHNKKITYLINDNKMVLSLKVDGKNYLSIKQIQRCENINQLMWMLLISVTIAVGIFFVYMMFYTYKNAEESQFEITKIKYGSIPEIIFLISLIPAWWLFSVNQNNTFIMITIAKLWMIWTFWILPIIIISRFLINPVDHYGFGGPYSKKSISTICVLIANICLGAFSEINMNRNTIVIGLALMIIIFIFSHCYLKNKVSKVVRVSFEIMVSMYGFFFLFLISYLKSF